MYIVKSQILGYTWKYSVDDDRLLLRNKTGAKVTTYSYNSYFKKINYAGAVAECETRGEGWHVASFQALFDFKDGEVIKNELYRKSMDNIGLITFKVNIILFSSSFSPIIF